MKYLDPKADLTEINSNTQEIPADLLNNPEIEKAVEELKISALQKPNSGPTTSSGTL